MFRSSYWCSGRQSRLTKESTNSWPTILGLSVVAPHFRRTLYGEIWKMHFHWFIFHSHDRCSRINDLNHAVAIVRVSTRNRFSLQMLRNKRIFCQVVLWWNWSRFSVGPPRTMKQVAKKISLHIMPIPWLLSVTALAELTNRLIAQRNHSSLASIVSNSSAHLDAPLGFSAGVDT